jgi:hypothetical protein
MYVLLYVSKFFNFKFEKFFKICKISLNILIKNKIYYYDIEYYLVTQLSRIRVQLS